MKHLTLILVMILMISLSSFGQDIPKKQVRSFFKAATRHQMAANSFSSAYKPEEPLSTLPSGIPLMLEKLRNKTALQPRVYPSGGDTLMIGVPPNDSLIVTGSFTHNGPILVYGNGILRFKHANATILGDLYVWGDHALVTADSSYLYFPQQFFYQRSLVIAGKGRVIYRNTTLDHSGLSHNLVLTDSARIDLDNVTNIGFTTTGMNLASEININKINQAGEFIVMDHSKLDFKNAKTILLWYQVPAVGIFHYSFPDGDTILSYSLNNTTPGVSGIDYSVRVDTSTDIMWALMPVNGSDVSISNSKIRAIGLWFLGHDTINISGLVDNSVYTDFTANLSDRTLHLANSSVMTWSLYPMDTVNLNVTGCIVGEIGSEANCHVVTTDAFVDGSGGYWWATGHTFMVGDNCMAVNAIRSTQDALFIFAYSTLSQGETSAQGNSILMLVQSQLPDLPVLYDGSCIWYSFIGKTSSAFVDTIVEVYGSAWIDKTPSSSLMDFGWYRLDYQKSGDTAWKAISQKIYKEKRDEILAGWDTHGLSPGLYYIRLVLSDNTVDSFQNEGVRAINLLPRLFGVNELNLPELKSTVIPDPVTRNSVIRFSLPESDDLGFSVTDLSGKLVYRQVQRFSAGENRLPIGELNLAIGDYIYSLRTKTQKGSGRFIVQ